ncbi:MAG: polysaccharide deacetylase family protein [Pseudomonadota bacterium]|nr:polysaccharide deacetylase family protein [Pseudomonadota bacterium]
MMKILTHIALAGLLAASMPANADLVVLQYHHVSDSTPPSTSTSTSLFRAQLDHIEELGLPVATLPEATRQALAGQLENQQKIAITFDDAYGSVYTNAAPLLRERGYPYTIFINTNAVGKRGYMTWKQLGELGESPLVTLANHSADHAHLPRRPGEGEAAWRRRVQNSLDRAAEALEDRLGDTAPLFAYPYGEYDKALEAMLAERGWLGYGQQSGAIGETSHNTRLPRFPMANQYGQLSGLKNKLMSKAFPVDAETLPDSILKTNPPELTLQLNKPLDTGRLTCFASGQGRIPVNRIDKTTATIRAPDSFSSRRLRYNCTYPAGDGSYYWLSQQWVDLSRPED